MLVVMILTTLMVNINGRFIPVSEILFPGLSSIERREWYGNYWLILDDLWNLVAP